MGSKRGREDQRGYAVWAEGEAGSGASGWSRSVTQRRKERWEVVNKEGECRESEVEFGSEERVKLGSSEQR